MVNVVYFSDIHKGDVDRVGGKGANLGEMANANFPIPPGFCTTSEAYFKFLDASAIRDFIKQQTAGLDSQDSAKLKAASDAIKKKITGSPIPQDIRDDIVKAYNQLCGAAVPTPDQEIYVAVRSSATAEDLPEASFAGQQATFLNLKGADNVVKGVRDCWASLFEQRAIYYRQEQGYDHLKVGLSAVVQLMVQSEKSGVMFSVDPVSNNRNLLVIEGAFGLGEVVVSGSVTPDRYVIDKSKVKIADKHIARQDWMLTRMEKGNEKVNIKEEFRERQKLSDAEIIELAKVGMKIEAHYGKPQDMEWAFSEGKLYIVQSRPITTLKEPKKAGEEDDEDEEGGEEMDDKIPIAKAKMLTKGVGASPGAASGPVKFIASPEQIGDMVKGSVLVTGMTTPDFVPAMKKAVAIVTDEGGSTCHAAIVSRELGVPCIVGTGNATKLLKDGMMITVDASRGIVYEGDVAVIKPKKRQVAADVTTISPVTATKIYVNLAEVDLAEKVAQEPVDGVGLLRAEFMIAAIGEHPRKLLEENRGKEFTDKLAEGLRTFAAAFSPRPVVYRATDFKTNEYRNLKGGDKYEPKEANPMMGYRGCSRYIREPDIFKLEVDAIRKVREEYKLKNLWLMIPFVRTVEELRQVKKLLHEFGLERGRDFKLWIMVEVPSTAFLIDKFCEEGIDGISIGSNDLTQLTLGIDRDNASLSDEFDERDDAVMAAIERVIRTCKKYGVTASLCGQAPSVYPEFAEKLVEFGITSMSINPDVIVKTRKLVASAEMKVLLRRTSELCEKCESCEHCCRKD